MAGLRLVPNDLNAGRRSVQPSKLANMSEAELCGFSAKQVDWYDIRDAAEILWAEYEQEDPHSDRRSLLSSAVAALEEKLWGEYERDSPGGFAECRVDIGPFDETTKECTYDVPCAHGVTWDYARVRPDLSMGPKVKIFIDVPGDPRPSHIVVALWTNTVLSGEYARPADALLLGRHARTVLLWASECHSRWWDETRAERRAESRKRLEALGPEAVALLDRLARQHGRGGSQ